MTLKYDIAADALRMREAGESMRQIASYLACCDTTVRRALLTVGGRVGRTPPPSPWTAELVERAIELRGRGMTFGQIGQRLGMTKGQVIGKLDRMGLCRPARPSKPRRDRRPPRLVVPPPPPLTDADFRGCRYIAGEPRPLRPGMCCGKPVVPARIGNGEAPVRSWCAEHLAIVTQRHS